MLCYKQCGGKGNPRKKGVNAGLEVLNNDRIIIRAVTSKVVVALVNQFIEK